MRARCLLVVVAAGGEHLDAAWLSLRLPVAGAMMSHRS